VWGIHLSSACLPRCGNHQASCAIRITRLPLLLLCSSSPPSRPRDQSRARAEGSKGQGARSEEQGARRQWSNHQWSNEHRRLHAKYSSRRANRGSVALCSYVALPIVSTEPSLSVPNRPSWSPPIFSGYYFESKRKYSVRTVLCCTVRTKVVRPAGCTTNHGRRRCSKRSTTWIFSTGVSGHAHFRGGLLGTGIARATVTGLFGHAPEGADAT
jgi:hypothetical protein